MVITGTSALIQAIR